MHASLYNAMVLSNNDIIGGPELLLHNCEDCACAVSERVAPAEQPDGPADAPIDGHTWSTAPETVEISLDPEHTLLFNPVGDGEPVVVNATAYGIFHRFDRPARLSEVGLADAGEHDAIVATVRRFSQLSLLQPGAQRPQPRLTDSSVLTAWLHVTNACNLRCPYCYIHKTAEGMDDATGVAAVNAVVASAVKHGFQAVKLKYAGGEASLDHRLMLRLHQLARELTAERGLRLDATLLSNGVHLPAGLIKTMRDQEIKLMVSLDGVGEQHDAQRPTVNGGPSFRFVERTISRLIRLGHPPHLSITVTGRNAAGLADAVRFALDRDLTFSLNFFRDNECASTFTDLQYEEQAIIDAMLAAFSVIEERLPRWSVLGAVLDRGQLLERRQRSCGVGQDYVVIDQRGRVAKCHMEIERSLGDVFTHDPLSLVRADTSSALNLISDEKEGCRNCTWRYSCSGGCTIATFRATGRYDVKSPNCNIYKAIYPAALRLEGLRLLKYAAPSAVLAPAADRRLHRSARPAADAEPGLPAAVGRGGHGGGPRPDLPRTGRVVPRRRARGRRRRNRRRHYPARRRRRGDRSALVTRKAPRVPQQRRRISRTVASVSQHLAETAAATRRAGRAASERPRAG
jgi:uncharacterized protein